MTRRLLVTGSRHWTDRSVIVCALSDAAKILGEDQPITLVHGAAPGADTIASQVWQRWHETWPELFTKPETHPADWSQGKAAGPRRNQAMVDLGGDLCVTFALADSRGTHDCATKARTAGIPVLDFGAPTTTNTTRRAA